MDVDEFNKYTSILEEKPFALYPSPTGAFENKFTYVDHSLTHVRIESVSTKKHYLLPLVLVEFANPGVLRLVREVDTHNGSFV